MKLSKCSKLLLKLVISLSFFAPGIILQAAESDVAKNQKKQDPYAEVDLTGLKTDCFYNRSVSSWTVLDRTRLIVYEGSKRRAFLVEISPPSFSLRSASEIAFVSNNSRVCGRAGERVLIDDSPSSGSFIVAITRLDEARRDQFLAMRKQIKADKKATRKSKQGQAEESTAPATIDEASASDNETDA